MNQNGEVSISDAVTLQNQLKGDGLLTDQRKKSAADDKGDGAIAQEDIDSYLVEQIDALPVKLGDITGDGDDIMANDTLFVAQHTGAERNIE